MSSVTVSAGEKQEENARIDDDLLFLLRVAVWYHPQNEENPALLQQSPLRGEGAHKSCSLGGWLAVITANIMRPNSERHPWEQRSKTVTAMPTKSRLWYRQGSWLWVVAACACYFILWVTSTERHRNREEPWGWGRPCRAQGARCEGKRAKARRKAMALRGEKRCAACRGLSRLHSAPGPGPAPERKEEEDSPQEALSP
ncbi:hypothetical protein Anapl_06796 [Anas platyrhynchos]|uniref:Uncharacterized protein n=1 Tax=Anas platyrhynchos TaxID=8839 RepID=R0K7P8_ANAPL|nr:hypothetical protein Anapl_06796 [Anas platyrhynchos]